MNKSGSVVLIVLASIATMAIVGGELDAHSKRHKVNKTCLKKCSPYQAASIDEVCHCKTPTGWTIQGKKITPKTTHEERIQKLYQPKTTSAFEKRVDQRLALRNSCRGAL